MGGGGEIKINKSLFAYLFKFHCLCMTNSRVHVLNIVHVEFMQALYRQTNRPNSVNAPNRLHVQVGKQYVVRRVAVTSVQRAPADSSHSYVRVHTHQTVV